MRKHLIVCFSFALLNVFSTNIFSSAYSDNNAADSVIGKPGDASNVTRIIKITVIENRFLPSEIDVTQGETIRFVVKSAGNEQHEMIIDTMDNLQKQAKIRRTHPEAKAAEQNQIHLAPGEQKELIWQFTRAGTIDFACPLPGHFKGMRGKINVEKK